MGDLSKLEGNVPVSPSTVPPILGSISTPLKWEAWATELESHPDREYAQYIVAGIKQGFRIGFNYESHRCNSAKSNMFSAVQHPQPIEAYISKEVAAGQIIGPIPVDVEGIHVSRFGIIPKPHQQGKWRLITDLSHPHGCSVNDGIDPQLCSLSYVSVDDAVRTVWRLGVGTVLAKFDLDSAYRQIPVHPQDRLLLGVMWRGQRYVDGALPFGLRSAPKLFNAVADALLWIMGQHGIKEAMHYLDDFLVFGSPESQECERAMAISLQLCKQLGVLIAPQKLEGPATAISFLGILIDTQQMELRLPEEKLSRLKGMISKWKGRKSCRKRELLSLIGQLQHACRVVRAGRTFLRRMIDLSTVVVELHHHIRLNKGFRSDLQWWDLFLEGWNGVSMFASLARSSTAMVLTSDASGSWGCGAFESSGKWFQIPWRGSLEGVHITVKELLPVVVACALWGSHWRGMTVCCRCDNAAVVAILRSGTSRHSLVMHLLRCLFFFVAYYQIYLDPVHLPGSCNEAADSLSRNNIPRFLQLVPTVQPLPTPLPAGLFEALVLKTPDWTSDAWMTVLRSTLPKDWQFPP